jgi:hypothetical protein
MLHRRRESSSLRRVTRAHVSRARTELPEPILLRYSRDDDRAALERLAALDSRRLPDGVFLVAEVDGELVAAAALEGEDEPLSDPFRPAAAVRELLALRRGQIRRSAEAVARPGTQALPAAT